MTEEYFRKLVIRLLIAILFRLLSVNIHSDVTDKKHTALYYEAYSHVKE